MTAKRKVSFLPQWLIAERKRGIPSELRPFGSSPGDLSVPFRLAQRPETITALLALCCRAANVGPADDGAPDPGLFLEMPVGMRIEALLSLTTLTDASPFSWRVRCDFPSCAEENEFELTVEQILSLCPPPRELQTKTISIGGVEAILRRPTGLDQMRWLTQSAEGDGQIDSEAMLRSILVQPALEDLLTAGETLDSVAHAVDEAMDSFDPLLGFHLSVVCPQCGATKDVAPDLADAALERLFRAQRAAIEDVHRLASHYHWSENQILELPEWRRQNYLELIEAGAG